MRITYILSAGFVAITSNTRKITWHFLETGQIRLKKENTCKFILGSAEISRI